MKRNPLGTSDLTISAVGLGCFAFAGGQTWGEQAEADSVATIEAALDVGIDFFDTAEGYGDGYSEELLGRVLQGRRGGVAIASKASAHNLATGQPEQDQDCGQDAEFEIHGKRLRVEVQERVSWYMRRSSVWSG